MIVEFAICDCRSRLGLQERGGGGSVGLAKWSSTFFDSKEGFWSQREVRKVATPILLFHCLRKWKFESQQIYHDSYTLYSIIYCILILYRCTKDAFLLVRTSPIHAFRITVIWQICYPCGQSRDAQKNAENIIAHWLLQKETNTLRVIEFFSRGVYAMFVTFQVVTYKQLSSKYSRNTPGFN